MAPEVPFCSQTSGAQPVSLADEPTTPLSDPVPLRGDRVSMARRGRRWGQQPAGLPHTVPVSTAWTVAERTAAPLLFLEAACP